MSQKPTPLPPGAIPPGTNTSSPFDGSGMGGGEGLLKLKDLLPKLLSRWHWIVLGTILGLVVGFYQVWKSVPVFQSRATVLVRDYSVDALGKNAAAEFDIRNSQAIETIRAGILTYELSESVASDPEVRELKNLVPTRPKSLASLLGGGGEESGTADTPPVPVLTNMVRSWISATTRPDTRLIDINVRHTDPTVAREVANEVVDHYMKLRTESRTGDQEDTLKFLMAEARRVKTELQAAQNTLYSYSKPLEAEKALTDLEAEESILSQRYGPKHPKMVELRGKMEGARERLRSGLQRVIANPVDADYWDAHRATLGDLDSEEVVSKARDLIISRHSVLQSEVQSQDSLYSTLLAHVETGVMVTENPEAEVARQESALTGIQVAPDKTKLLMGSTFVGLFAGFGLAFLFTTLDNKFHTVTDLEHLSEVPVLAAVGQLGDRTKPEAKGRMARLEGGAPGQERWSPYLVFKDGEDLPHFEEMFRVLRTSISLLGPASERKLTMITSALPGEGKTHVAANLAVAFAQQGLKTLLVDLDLRKPSLHKMFGLEKDDHPGMVDLLSGNATLAEALQPCPGQERLSVILSGPKAPNPGELLESSRIQRIIEEFRGQFDHLVFDTAPLLAVPDSRMIAPYANNLTMVVRAEYTSRGPVKAALEMLASSGNSPVGMVLNDYAEERTIFGKALGTRSYGSYGYGRYGYGAAYGNVYGQDEES